MTTKYPKRMALSALAIRGLGSDEVVRVIGKNDQPGRAVYIDAGWMWRERADNQHYVAPDHTIKRRRYLPGHTIVEISKA